MSRVVPDKWIASWNHGANGLQYSANDFYNEVERALKEHHLDNIKVERVQLHEGGMFSAKREYLQILRKENVFLICAAPFGNLFFVSWWLGYAQSGTEATFGQIPVLGFLVRNFIKRQTFYSLDTASMFQTLTHSIVSDTLNGILTAKGMRALSDTERAPSMSNFFAQMSGA
jgi:hypothetical protein